MTREAARIRRHPFLPEQSVLDAIPRLYETESVSLAEKVIYLHYFVGGADWYVAEIDDAGQVGFGFVDLGSSQDAEWGYIDLRELRSVVAEPRGYPVVVERDLHWSPCPFSRLRDSGTENRA